MRETLYGIYVGSNLIGHVVARQRKAALELLPDELAQSPDLILVRSAAAAPKEAIAASPCLGVEARSGNPRTKKNRTGGGRPRSGDTQFCTNFGLSTEAASRFRALPNKSKWLKALIEKNI